MGVPPRRGLAIMTRALPRRMPARASRYVLGASLGAAAIGAAFALESRPVYAEERVSSDPLSALDPDRLRQTNVHLADRPVSRLLVAYTVYLASSSPLVIRVGTSFLAGLDKLREVLPLGIGHLPWAGAQYVIRKTAFSLFAGGETAEGCFPLLDKLGRGGIAGLLCYSVEAEKAAKGAGEGLIEANLEETKRAIRAAGSYQRSRDGELAPTWIAVKLSGMVADPQIFERASTALQSSSAWQRGQRLPPEPLFPSSPALTSTDESVLSALHVELDICAALASTLNVRLDVDAEQSWLQDAVDRYYQVLADRHNAGRTQAIVGQTYQTYRIDTRDRLLADLAHARAACLPSLTKLVRGAYHEAENARAARLRRPSPVWPSKAATDECYDACAEIMADEVIRDVRSADTRHPQVGVLFASHNAESTQKTLARFREAGLVRNAGRQLEVSDALRGRIVFGQLLGMSDNLTATLANLFVPSSTSSAPLVLKYIPYGAVAQVLPYLVRRAQENKAVLSGDGTGGRGVREERRAVSRELRRRVRAMVPWD